MPFTKRPDISIGPQTYGYWEWLPAGYNPSGSYPLFIYYHGIGSLGSGTSSSLEVMKSDGMSGVIWSYGDSFPINAIVICPQYDSYLSGYSVQSHINYLKANYAVDASRIYLSGFSYGGAVLEAFADVGTLTDVAAIITAAGVSTYSTNLGNKLKNANMPVLLHHGTSDITVPFSRSQGWYDGLVALGSSPTPVFNGPSFNADHTIGQTVFDPYYVIPSINLTTFGWALQYTRTSGGGSGGGGGTNPPQSGLSKVNVGGQTETFSGVQWVGLQESQVSGGTFTDVFGIWGNDQTIINTGSYSQEIYKSARWSGSGFTITYPYPNGSYTLRMHFCEFWKNGSGINVFNVSVQGTQVISNLDIWSAAGGRYRAMYIDVPVTISNGNVVIQTSPTAGYAALNAFEILEATTPPPSPNQPPTANAGPDQNINTSSTTLSGTATDPEGGALTYAWTKVSGGSATITSPSSLSTTVTGLSAGTYVFRLTVTDPLGLSVSDDVTVVVNAAPSVNAGADQQIAPPANSVTLTAVASDSDGTIATYLWTKVSGSGTIASPSSASTIVTGLTAGSSVFRITVTDNGGLTSSDDVSITVLSQTNQPPTANAGPDQLVTLPSNSATLSGSGSDSDGTIVSYLWARVSGPSGSTISSPNSAVTTVTGLISGTYVFRLTVTDNLGATASDDVVVTVNSQSVVYVKYVGRRFSPNGAVSVTVGYEDNTSEQITQRSGSNVRSASRLIGQVDGQSRPTALIWYFDGTSRVITKKGE